MMFKIIISRETNNPLKSLASRNLSKVMTSKDENNRSSYNLIGPPNPESNLRPIKYKTGSNESKLEKKLREKREEIQEWNETFWRKHNTDFIKEREKFKEEEMKRYHGRTEGLNAEEMSVFYKQFLDKNWKTHLTYNFTWYRKNIEITFFDFRLQLQKLFHR